MTTLVIVLGACGAIALFRWLNNRPIRRTRAEVIHLMERALITGGDSAWDDFVCVRIADAELEAVRQKCSDVNFEPPQIFNEKLRQILAELRKSN